MDMKQNNFVFGTEVRFALSDVFGADVQQEEQK